MIFEALAPRRVQRHLAFIPEGEFCKNQGDYTEAAVVACQRVVSKSNELQPRGVLTITFKKKKKN